MFLFHTLSIALEWLPAPADLAKSLRCKATAIHFRKPTGRQQIEQRLLGGYL
jgi:hypothetical protein